MKKLCQYKEIIFNIFFIAFLIFMGGKAEPIENVKFQGHLLRYTLDNGLTVILKEVHSAPIIAFQMWVKAGSIHEGEYLGSGITHYIEHMLFKGTEKRKVGDIARLVKEAGGELGAYTGFDRMVFYIVLPKDKVDLGLDIIADVAFHSTFDPAELEKERQVILKEINMHKDDPNRTVSELLFNTAYTFHPFRHPVIGYKELFSKLTREDLVKYYERVFVPSNLILSIAGDFKIEDIKPKVEDVFGKYPFKVFNRQMLPDEPPQLSLRRAEVEKEVNIAYLEMGYHICSIQHEDVFALDVLATILGDGRSSRLYKEVKEKKKLVNSIDTWAWTPKEPGLFGISATLDQHENLPIVEKVILEQIELIKNKPVSVSELEKAKKLIKSAHIFKLETVEGHAGELASNEYYTDNVNFSDIYLERVSKVTQKDIQRVARKYLNKENLTIAVVKSKRDSAAIISESNFSTEIKSYRPFFTEKSVVTTLRNGIRVIINENHTLPIVSLRAVFKGGVLYENEKNNGITNLLVRTLIKGTKNRTADKIAEEIESVGGSLNIYSGQNSFGISIDILKPDLELGLNILSDIILNPIFAEEEIEKEKKVIIGEIQRRDDQLFSLGMKKLRETLFTVHPYRMDSLGTIKSVESLTREDLITFYKQLCVPDNMVLAIFGDVDCEPIIKSAEKKFKKLEKRDLFQPEKVIEPPIDSARETTEYLEKEQALILLGYHGADIRNSDRYVLEVITSILSGQGGRLFERIREEHGLAYYTGAFSVLGLDPGMYVFYTGTVTEKYPDALKLLFDEIKRIKSETVAEEELERAKNELIGNKAIDLQTNRALALESALDELYGLGYNNCARYAEYIKSVTKEDILRVANKYFQDNNYALVILLPKKK